jgi:hypothetical protein
MAVDGSLMEMDSLSKDERPTRLVWSDTTEELLVSWCDIGKCYAWLHERSFRKYNRANYFFSIPIIVLSTLSGAASVGLSGYVPSEYMQTSQLSIGLVNILTGIITTLQTFFRYAQNSESQLNASIGWAKLCRNITIELSLERDKRKNANEFVKICRAEYDRLMERSPIIPSDILIDFKNNMKLNNDMVVPDILDKIAHTSVYKNFSNEFKTLIRSHESVKSSVKKLPDKYHKKDSPIPEKKEPQSPSNSLKDLTSSFKEEKQNNKEEEKIEEKENKDIEIDIEK